MALPPTSIVSAATMGIQGRAIIRANYKGMHDFLNRSFRDATFRHLLGAFISNRRLGALPQRTSGGQQAWSGKDLGL